MERRLFSVRAVISKRLPLAGLILCRGLRVIRRLFLDVFGVLVHGYWRGWGAD